MRCVHAPDARRRACAVVVGAYVHLIFLVWVDSNMPRAAIHEEETRRDEKRYVMYIVVIITKWVCAMEKLRVRVQPEPAPPSR